MLYDYICDSCGQSSLDEFFSKIGQPIQRRCSYCQGILRRAVCSFGIAKGMNWSMEPHYNDTVGAPVSSMHEFTEMLKVRSAEQTEATGMVHDYQPFDPRDRDAFGITAEGVEVNAAANRGVRLDDHMKQKALTESQASWGDAPEQIGEKT